MADTHRAAEVDRRGALLLEAFLAEAGLFELESDGVRRRMAPSLVSSLPAGEAILEATADERFAVLMAALEARPRFEPGHEGHRLQSAYPILIDVLFRRPLPSSVPHLTRLAHGLEISAGSGSLPSWIERLVAALETMSRETIVPPEARAILKRVRNFFLDDRDDEARKLGFRLDHLIGEGSGGSRVVLVAEDRWAEAAGQHLAGLSPEQQALWVDLLSHGSQATAGTPTRKWSKRAGELLQLLSDAAFQEGVIDWFAKFEEPRSRGRGYDLHAHDTIVLKGLVWVAGQLDDIELSRAIGRLAVAAFRKLPGVGPRSISVGNAAVYALGQMPGEIAIAQLAMLKIKVKGAAAQKGIEKALAAAARRMQIPRDEIEEMAIPSYGLEDIGRMEEHFGEFTARLTVGLRGKTELVWVRADSGKAQKSIPAAVKADFSEELKALKGTAKDIERMVPAQRDRIDNLFLDRKVWPFRIWRERYLDHPVVGLIARRLIWKFVCGKESADGVWHDGSIVDADGLPLGNLDEPGTAVELWHPVGRPLDDVLAWRGWIERHEIRQPFKQAHREVYLLTDAERRTNTYSNRYAAHILRQHQFHALCGVRGWKNTLRLMVDNIYAPPTKLLPKWGLRAEFWVEGAGDRYGTDTTDSGSYLYLATDQVRFYRIQADQRYAHAYGGGYELHGRGINGAENPADQPLPLDLIPPLVFSEVLRDVDLFVGVCSVGNDPTWADGGLDGRYATYWTDFSFGDLSVTAKTRKEVLERLIPRLKIAARCSFDEKFLRVRGDLRTYKIHLGSGNILMEPNDQYLCIVPDGKMEKGADGMFLPFEGDRTLSIILSKAMLLAADTKITDTTITRQIGA